MAGLVESRVEENPCTKGWISDEFMEIHALKPDFETGSKAALRSGSRPTTKWQVVVDEFDDETIDEDTLLDESEPFLLVCLGGGCRAPRPEKTAVLVALVAAGMDVACVLPGVSTV